MLMVKGTLLLICWMKEQVFTCSHVMVLSFIQYLSGVSGWTLSNIRVQNSSIQAVDNKNILLMAMNEDMISHDQSGIHPRLFSNPYARARVKERGMIGNNNLLSRPPSFGIYQVVCIKTGRGCRGRIGIPI